MPPKVPPATLVASPPPKGCALIGLVMSFAATPKPPLEKTLKFGFPLVFTGVESPGGAESPGGGPVAVVNPGGAGARQLAEPQAF